MPSSMPTIPIYMRSGIRDRQANSTVTEQQTTYKRNRHTITLVLSQLSDLKVEEGQRINVGDVISDKPTAWLRYALPKEPNYKPRSRG